MPLLVQSCGEHRQVFVGDRLGRGGEPAQQVAGKPIGAQGPRPQPGRGDNRLEPELWDRGKHLRLEAQVGVRAEAQEGRDPFRVVETEPEPDERH